MSEADPNKEPETFSREYVHELREENKGLRLKGSDAEKRAAAAEQAANEAAAAAEKRAKEAEEAAQKKIDEARAKAKEGETAAAQRALEAQQRADARLIQAEMRLAATKAGMVDMDGLKLVDMKDVKLNDDGTVTGADEAIAAAKKAKPYLFAKTTTSNPDPAPDPNKDKKNDARSMNDADWKAARDRIRRGEKV